MQFTKLIVNCISRRKSGEIHATKMKHIKNNSVRALCGRLSNIYGEKIRGSRFYREKAERLIFRAAPGNNEYRRALLPRIRLDYKAIDLLIRSAMARVQSEGQILDILPP